MVLQARYKMGEVKSGERAKCGHCGYVGYVYGMPTSDKDHPMSAPWCPNCQHNNKLEPAGEEEKKNTISFRIGDKEMFRIEENGDFYVKGKKVIRDVEVYQGLRSFLIESGHIRKVNKGDGKYNGQCIHGIPIGRECAKCKRYY